MGWDPWGDIKDFATDAWQGTIGEVGDWISGEEQTQAAIDAQRDAAKEANQINKYIYDQNREDLQPWRDQGRIALGQLGHPEFQDDFDMADFQRDPGYQFRMDQGMNAIQNSAAARGNLNSGRTMKDLMEYGQDFASNEYNNAYNRWNNDRNTRFNRLASLAGIGQTATGQGINSANNYGANTSNTAIGMGNAIASANIAQANRQGQLLGGLMGFGGQLGGAAILASDRRVKENIKPISKEDMNEFRRSIRPYMFNYVDPTYGDGDYIGVMAQDLERSKLGRMVVKTIKGVKQIDMKKLASLLVASMAVE